MNLYTILHAKMKPIQIRATCPKLKLPSKKGPIFHLRELLVARAYSRTFYLLQIIQISSGLWEFEAIESRKWTGKLFFLDSHQANYSIVSYPNLELSKYRGILHSLGRYLKVPKFYTKIFSTLMFLEPKGTKILH